MIRNAADQVALLVIAPLQTGVPFTRPVMEIAALTDRSNLVTNAAADQVALPAAVTAAAVA